MILEKNQIERYLRHIIMPEISGPGQKKLLESQVFIYGNNVKTISALVYYLAASGIGTIICTLSSPDGFNELALCIQDLNEDVTLKLTNQDNHENLNSTEHIDNIPSCRVVLGNYTFVMDHLKIFSQTSYKYKFIPTITAIHNSWNGFFHVLLSYNQVQSFLNSIKIEDSLPDIILQDSPIQSPDDILASGFLGTLSAIACIKIFLGIGEMPENPLFADLLSMEFENVKLNDCRDSLIKRLILKDEITLQLHKETLSKSKILIIGAGGLGSPAAFALAHCGIGTIGIVDYDRVEISNLNRQILHSTSRIGMEKVKSAEEFIKGINPEINVETYALGFTKENALTIIKDFDVIIDGVDNLPARYLINDACYFAKKPFIESGVIRFDGLNTTIIPGESACYRCFFPGEAASNRAKSCAETGVLGPVPGLMGFIQAAETIKLLIKEGQPLQNRIVYFSGEDFEFTPINLSKDPNCQLCGDNPHLAELGDYNFSCENSE